MLVGQSVWAVRHAPFIYTDAVLFVDLSTSLFFAWMLLHTSLCPSAFLKRKKKHKHVCVHAHVCLQDVHSCKRNVLG